MGFAENLGVVVNMKDRGSPLDEEYHRWLAADANNNCFTHALPRVHAMQQAAQFQHGERSYLAKYPGDVGVAVRGLVDEILTRATAASVPTEARAAGE
jgi:chromosome partitioning protein